MAVASFIKESRHDEYDLLKFKLSLKMWKTTFWHDCWCQTELVLQEQLIYWTWPFQRFILWSEKEIMSRKWQLCRGKCLVGVRELTSTTGCHSCRQKTGNWASLSDKIMKTVWKKCCLFPWFQLQHSNGNSKIWHKQHEDPDLFCLVLSSQAGGCVMRWGIFLGTLWAPYQLTII